MLHNFTKIYYKNKLLVQKLTATYKSTGLQSAIGISPRQISSGSRQDRVKFPVNTHITLSITSGIVYSYRPV